MLRKMKRNKINNNLVYWNNQVINNIFRLKPFLNNIVSESYKNGINPNLLLGIIAIEKTNRNRIYNLVEYILASIVPNLFIKLNPSIGIAQIRISTLKDELETELSSTNIQKLMDSGYSISILAKLVSKYCKEIDFDSRTINTKNFEEKLLNIVKKYTTGKYQCPNYPWVLYYFYILKDIVKFNWVTHIIAETSPNMCFGAHCARPSVLHIAKPENIR